MASTGSPKSSSVGSSRPPLSCPLYMECDEEPLSMSQLCLSRKKKTNLFSQLAYLENLAKSASHVGFTQDNLVIRVPDGSSSAPSSSHPPPPASSSSSSSYINPQQQQPGYRLIMDPRTGRILGTIDSGGKSVAEPNLPAMSNRPIFPPVQNKPPVSTAPPVRPKSHRSSPVIDLTRQPSPMVNDKPVKSFIPTLLVVPKASKSLSSVNMNSKRSELDSRVKALLVHNPSKFTEWLIQQGLIPSEQYEEDSVTGVKVKLKLGMYSDGKKFPSSGGYVWINESKANKCVSVYSGSLFMATNHSPTVILKLIYHWSCQTNVQNVVQWVKVEHQVINVYYKLFRSVCTVAVHDKVVGLGGLNKTIQIGVISLGTTSAESAKREMKVEVLGVLEVDTGIVRLRATEPALGVTQAERFARIFEPLPNWVSKNSWIITDFSVDKGQLTRLGYHSVVQCSVNSKNPENTNSIIMDFLKRVVPKMFQNNLSYLSTAEIQQFLDELTFREINSYPLACFDSLINKISQITTALRGSSSDFVSHLQKVQDNPFLNWQLKSSPASSTDSRASLQNFAKKRTVPTKEDEIDAQVNKRIKVSSELVDLESYFYGSLPGDMKILTDEFKADMAFKCPLCRKVFMNNIDFMKHLFLHVKTQRPTPVDLSDLRECKYCSKDFDSSAELESHMDSRHYKKDFKFLCQICNESFRLKNHLIHHMTKAHVRSELPYLCNICGFRSSSHRNLVDHFHAIHDRTDKLQCPLCLKVCSLTGERGYNSSVASSYISHIRLHRERKSYPCKSCSLIFIQTDNLRNHVIRDHASFKEFENLEVYQYNGTEDPIQMPRPDERLARTAAKKTTGFVRQQPQMTFAAQNLEDMVMYNVDKEECGECSKRIKNPGHFAAYLCCTKCRYSTCCSKAISVHCNLFHGSSKPVYTLGAPCILDDEIYCVCGFSTFSGNKMAKHLAINGCKSAYPNKETAIKAIKTSFNLTEVAKKKIGRETARKSVMKSPAEKGPLSFLGLQRKSLESSLLPHSAEENGKEYISDEFNSQKALEPLIQTNESDNFNSEGLLG